MTASTMIAVGPERQGRDFGVGETPGGRDLEGRGSKSPSKDLKYATVSN
jgi:hypothetical protein